MKPNFFILLFLSIFILSCGNNNDQTKSSNDNEIISNSQNELNKELDELKQQGVFGKWECNFTGYESIIYLKKEGGDFSSIIEFKNSNSPKKIEKLVKSDDKYLVSESTAKEYYVINKDGNLELWDKDGLFTTAINKMPNEKSTPLSDMNLKNAMNQNIQSFVGNYSKSSPETLDGTDSKYWIVYYKDINVTFKVYKKTNNIEEAQKGKIPNLK